MSIVEFLLARVSDDEAQVHDAERSWHAYGSGCNSDRGLDWCPCGAAARVLAECEAKRRIVELYAPTGRFPDLKPEHHVVVDGILRILAEPYSSHPDYDESWRA